eukprot:XP_011604308.1 PREDICTED: protein NYNRIN isoform X1 [Takifugu rubripes]
MGAKIQWTPEALAAFTDLKLTLQTPPTLGIPDPDRPFTQTVDERQGCMTSVLLEEHGGSLRPAAYFSCKLDPDTLPSLFLCHTWSLPSSMSNALPISQLQDEGEPHDCVAELSISCSPRPDLSDQPLLNPDLLLFVDGSASRDPASGRCQAGYAICDSHGVLESASLPSRYSAGAAELVALTRACHFATKQSVTIYTDSRYAFGVVHDFGALWKHRGFLKSDGSPILNHQLVAALLEAILLPSQVAVCKCAAHTNLSDPISAGNARADAAAARPPPSPTVCAVQVPSSLSAIQSLATPHDNQPWRQAGAAHTPEGWIGPNDNPCLPSALFHHYAKLTHGLDHASKGGMLTLIAEHWFTKGFTPVTEKFCKACVICATHNPGKAVTPTAQAAHPPPTRPFEHVMMDFIELHPAEGKKFCLVFVDMWSKWVEAIPTSKADANSEARALITEIIPRWGIPEKISSDNATHFVNEALTQISVYLGMNLKRHCAYHPQSGGAVERENRSLKAKMAKCCEETGLPWTKVLPLALMYMRMCKHGRANLSPFEILFAGIPNVGANAL